MPSPAPKANITDIATLNPLDGEAGFQFGISVAISGTSSMIGAPFAIDNEKTTGAAYLFENVSYIISLTCLLYS